MKEKNKTIVAVVITILIMMVLGLGGFIIYDKVINKEVPPIDDNSNQEIQSTNQESNNSNSNNNQVADDADNDPNFIKKTSYNYTLNGKNHTAEIKYVKYEESQYSDMFTVEKYLYIDGKYTGRNFNNGYFYSNAEDYSNIGEIEITENHEIKGLDNNYYMAFITHATGGIAIDYIINIINDKGDIIDTISTGPEKNITVLNQKPKRPYGEKKYYIADDAIYMVAFDCKKLNINPNTGTYDMIGHEFKFTFNNGEMSVEDIGTYDIEAAGSPTCYSID